VAHADFLRLRDFAEASVLPLSAIFRLVSVADDYGAAHVTAWLAAGVSEPRAIADLLGAGATVELVRHLGVR
jgi:hypothetical protein